MLYYCGTLLQSATTPPRLKFEQCILLQIPIPQPAQALGLPFRMQGASECNAEYRKIIRANIDVAHLHDSIQAQHECAPCLLHSTRETCASPPCDLCVMGPPCPPFSTQRVKRFSTGSVKNHPLYEVTFTYAKDVIAQGRHGTCVLEQVQGFDRAEAGEDLTPLRRPASRQSAASLVESNLLSLLA